MSEDLNSSHQDEYPRPDSNGPNDVAVSLEAVANASDKESSDRAYNRFLYATGNNHAGTYYPVVLTTFTGIEEILRSGKPWPQRTIIEALIDLTGSFTPEVGYDLFRGQSLSGMLLERVRGLKDYFSLIAGGADVAAKSAGEMLELLNDMEQAGEGR